MLWPLFGLTAIAVWNETSRFEKRRCTLSTNSVRHGICSSAGTRSACVPTNNTTAPPRVRATIESNQNFTDNDGENDDDCDNDGDGAGYQGSPRLSSHSKRLLFCKRKKRKKWKPRRYELLIWEIYKQDFLQWLEENVYLCV